MKPDHPSYSFIIPHYNIPELLQRCLKSIPVREDIQVIVVDDCSPDSNRYLVDFPELSRPYLEFYHTSQGGSAGRARNVGLEHAKGKWLVFADADDYFEKDFVQVLDIHRDDQEDIVYFLTRGEKAEEVGSDSPRSDFFNDMIYKYLHDKDERWLRQEHVVPWSKMIKRELVEAHQIRFEHTRYSNDVLFNVKCGCLAKSIKVVQESIYTITSRSGSLAVKPHISNTEYICRTDVSFRAQHVICDVENKPSVSFVSGAMQRLLLENVPLFLLYWKKLKVEGFSQSNVYRYLSKHPNKRVRLRLLLSVLLSFIFPTSVLMTFVKGR